MESAVKAGKLEWVTHPLSEAHLHAPLHDPEKFICIGLNYIDHAEETKSPIPKEPPLFAKFPNAIVDATAPIARPKGCEKLDYEVELGFVMGREARDVPAERALDYIWGYVVVNDVSARDFQMVTTQWMAGKACDSFAPMGPWIADRAEIPDPHVLELRTWVNGTKLQDGNSKNLIYNINYLVAFLSAKMTLLPGDLVITGTPAGVGFTRKPPVLLKGGDRVRMEITGLGTLDNPVVEA
jgi:2-keto-4-pentenoate hydratase/2-oxohepta-3-ene-1,7-dioic acid hydratase in catechol pathway